MQALSDERHIAAVDAKVDRLDTKVDEGFAGVERGFESIRTQIVSSERALRSEILAARSDARADFRTLIAVVFAMWTTTVLAILGLLASHL